MKKNKVMDFFSALGRSLMMPIAALAACGIILGVTAALLKTQVVEAVPFSTTASCILYLKYTKNSIKCCFYLNTSIICYFYFIWDG